MAFHNSSKAGICIKSLFTMWLGPITAKYSYSNLFLWALHHTYSPPCAYAIQDNPIMYAPIKSITPTYLWIQSPLFLFSFSPLFYLGKVASSAKAHELVLFGAFETCIRLSYRFHKINPCRDVIKFVDTGWRKTYTISCKEVETLNRGPTYKSWYLNIDIEVLQLNPYTLRQIITRGV